MSRIRFGYISALLVGVSLSAFGQGGVEGLPDSFHEYVELTTRNGTQHYFDIDYRPTGNTVVEMAFMPRNLRTPFALFCSRLQATTNTYTAIYSGDLVDDASYRDAIRADYGSPPPPRSRTFRLHPAGIRTRGPSFSSRCRRRAVGWTGRGLPRGSARTSPQTEI